MTSPTKRQIEVLAFIHQHRARHGYAPSVRETCAEFGISPNGAHDHLRALERRGLITRVPKVARSLVVTDAGLEWIAGEAA